MAAPDATLLAALRSSAKPARHLFFRMTHSQGIILAWDGLGNRTFNGEVYTGIGNMASVEGVSRSRDLQTHEVVVTLNGVPYSALTSIDQSIKGERATITAAWYTVGGVLVASRVVFDGLGDFLAVPFGARTVSLRCHLRGLMADWARAPQAFYTPSDQARRFPGDTGFDYVKTLENTTVTGWAYYRESSGAELQYKTHFTNATRTIRILYPSIPLGRVLGSDLAGIMNQTDGTNRFTCMQAANVETLFRTEGTNDNMLAGAGTDVTDAGSSVIAYIDVEGFARSGAGERFRPDAAPTSYLRLCTEITSSGVATASTFGASAGGGNNYANGITVGAVNIGFASAPANNKLLAFVNSDGRHIFNNAGTIVARENSVNTNMVEAGTGNAVTLSGGLVKCNGANVVLSTTNVLLTSSGRVIIPTGGNAATDFARIWS